LKFLAHTPLYTHHPVVLLWASDQLVAEAAAYTTHNKHKTQTSIPSVDFQSEISASERLQTYAFDPTATGIDIF
jgi:hypothetical protein